MEKVKRYEGETLEEALLKASEDLGIEVPQLNYVVLQHPKRMLFIKRSAVIEVTFEIQRETVEAEGKSARKEGIGIEEKRQELDEVQNLKKTDEVMGEKIFHSNGKKDLSQEEREESQDLNRLEDSPKEEVLELLPTGTPTSLFNHPNSFSHSQTPNIHSTGIENKELESEKKEKEPETENYQKTNIGERIGRELPEKLPSYQLSQLDQPEFAPVDRTDKRESLSRRREFPFIRYKPPTYSEEELKKIEIEVREGINNLIQNSCFNLDLVQVGFIDGRVYIKLDGPDVPLLIGREGYRYTSFNNLIYYWISHKYNLKLRLEVGDFLESQERHIRTLLNSTIEEIEEYGHGRTPFLKGFLPYLALELLRERFPDKYVSLKEDNEGNKFVVVRVFYDNNWSNSYR